MTIAQVLAGVKIEGELPEGLSDLPVSGLDYDSRRIEKGFLFFAFPGAHADGRAFAAMAVERGAAAVVSESPKPEGFPGAWITVEHGRRALAIAARNFYGAPDERIGITGITGTNGKTTTAFLVDAILRAAGRSTALVSTIEYRLGGKVMKAVNTTPESLDLYRLFSELERGGGSNATMEVSSHALALGRVYGIHFHTALFTNLTRDHLDFHHTMEDYFAAKRLLFEGNGAPPPAFAAINSDDAYGRQIETAPGTERLWYGLNEGADVRATRIASNFDGLRFDVRSPRGKFQIESALVGRINVYNILAACCAGLSYGLSPETVAAGIAACRAVPGRFERIEEGQPFMVVVDYAHTDDALKNIIAVARGLSPKRVITLFGCGGGQGQGQAAADGNGGGRSKRLRGADVG